MRVAKRCPARSGSSGLHRAKLFEAAWRRLNPKYRWRAPERQEDKELRNEPRFARDFKSTPGSPVAYHAPCHLRAQAVGFRGRDLLRLIPGVTLQSVMECSGCTWGRRHEPAAGACR